MLALATGSLGALVFFRWPCLGLAVLIVASPIVPFAIGTGSQTSLNVTVLLLTLLLGLWILDMALKRDFRLLPSRPIRPLLGLALVSGLAFLAGRHPWLAFAQTAPLRAQLGGLAIFWLSIGAFLLVAHQVRDLAWLRWLVWLFLGIGGLYMLGRIVPALGNLVLPLYQTGATGSLFWTWMVALAFSQAMFNQELRNGWRLALGVLALATLSVSWFQGRPWASGWLPPLAAMVVIAWIGMPRLALPLTLSGVVWAGFNLPLLTQVVMVGDQEYSLMTRAEAWRILADVVRINPVLGLGPANYYWYTPLYSILGYYVNFNSHNNYMDTIAQVGLLGLACFLWFAWDMWRLGWYLRSHLTASFERAYVYGVLGGIVGTLAAGMLADWVLPFVYNIGLAGLRASIPAWLFLGGLVAIERATGSFPVPEAA